MLVEYYVQGLLQSTENTVTEALHLMKINQPSSFCNVVRLAQADGRTYRAQTAL